jgi:hypothetical protein
MHDTRDTNVILKCGSRPVIEDCNGIVFYRKPGRGDIGGGDCDCDCGVIESGDKSADVNYYDQVQDFKWLRSTKSPNWKVGNGQSDDVLEFVEKRERDLGTLNTLIEKYNQ